MTTTNKYLILALTVIAGLGVISCGPQKVATTSTSGLSSNTSITGNKPAASCSADVSGLTDYGVKLQTYSVSGYENTSWVRARYTKFPATLDTTSILSFWSYSVNSAGTASSMQLATFYVEYINSSNQASRLSNDVTTITWSDLKSMLSSAGISTTDISAAMKSVNFVVKFEGALSTSQVVMPTISLSTGVADRYVAALIPKFYANPADYAVGKPGSLQVLHPMKSYSYSTSEQYLSQSQINCIL